MLLKPTQDLIAPRDDSPKADSRATLLHSCLGLLRRQFWAILFCLIFSALSGGLYLLLTPPTFTASATMLIDSRRGGVQQKSVLGDVPNDWIDSQIGVLSLERDKIGQSVAKDLHLAKKPELFEPDNEIIGNLTAEISKLFRGGMAESKISVSDSEFEQRAAGAVAGGLDVKRVGLSYLVNINFFSHNQQLAVQIANAAADAYVVAEMNAKYEGLRQASEWLQERYQALREQASAADRAVVEFKSKNNIVTAGGKLINDQQLTEINNRLGLARAKTADAQARFVQIDSIIRNQEKTGTVDTTVPDALLNPIISRLRGQYLDIINKEADWSARFGQNHLAVVNLRNQARDIRNSTHQELKRIAESYRSEGQISKKNEEELEKQLAVIVAEIPNDAQSTLRGLETSAQSYRTYYDNFLLSYTESVQQQTSPIPETRVIAYATGAYKSNPSVPRVIMLTILGGAVFGIGFGMLREAFDRSLRTGGQVQAALQTDCVALIPLVKGRQRRISPPQQQLITITKGKSISYPAADLFRLVNEAPFSRFAESIRALKLAADLRRARDIVTIGFTSSLPGEGKSTIAAALAGHVAHVGQRVILLDCDLRNPALSRSLAPDANVGIIDVLSGHESVEQAVWTDPTTGLDFLPTGKISRLANTAEIFTSDAMKHLFDMLRLKYDYIVVDLSPLAPIVDVRATTELVDFYFFIIEWGQTKLDVVKRALKEASQVNDSILGIVLNKVDVTIMSRYEGYSGKYYNNRHFARYGYTD
jgi:succinoglycan biosynthesis transport protein ExoP